VANTYTANTKLPIPALGDQGWNVANDARATILDALKPVGGLACTTHEQPSSSLFVDIAPGPFVDQAGAVQTYAGISGQPITTATTKYLYLDGTSSWALVVGSSFPATPHVRVSSVIAGATTITSITDQRQAFSVCGSIAEGVNLVLGTATGTQIGTATTQKIGFYGKTPIVQPAIGSATAGATYTSAEQAILNAVVAAVRALGLGS
jgi:hypothetical protein